jgi:dTDP-4-dehydrorhamnose reductase
MPNNILILGANGMLGSSLFRYLSKNTTFNIVGSVRTEKARLDISRQGFDNIVTGTDACNKQQLKELFNQIQPKWVINCIGLIKQLDKSKSPAPSIEINSLLPHQIATLCSRENAKLIHFSTDCVFSGANGMYDENSLPDTTDLYGRSKLLGEVTYKGHLTLRTSIIGHEIARSISLIDWFLAQKHPVNGFSKAIFSGLPTIYIAEFLNKYILNGNNLSGLYHLSADPINKYDLLQLVKSQYQKNIEIINHSHVMINRSLDSTKLKNTIGFKPNCWTKLIEKMHNEYQEYFI